MPARPPEIELDRDTPYVIDVKRLYLPSVKVHADCPTCGRRVTRDLGARYLSYPDLNVPFDLGFSHEAPEDSVDHEFSVQVVLRITLELAPHVG
jgi:hypothetical protein